MLLPNGTNPKYSLYYVGAVILKQLLDCNGSMKIAELYINMKQQHDMSFSLMQFGLDWLYIIGAVENKRGKIVLVNIPCNQ